MCVGLHVKFPISLLTDFNETLISATDFRKSIQMPYLIKICPVGAKLFRADGQTDRETQGS